MKRIIHFLSENLLLLITLFLLIFIPLYPKLPILDIKHTWVYIRVEDFIMAVVWVLFFLQLLRKKATLKTPLTIPITAFWVIGGLATLHGVLFLFPNLQGVFPQLALLYWLRHVEYLSVFFLAFSAMRKKSFVTPVIYTLALTLLAVFLYGLGQRYLGFPAFLTMNEEFAKGIPLRLSALARIPSTFAGHYDLAAYLALLIPVMGSMVVGFKRWFEKLFFFLVGLSGLILLLMTASRVSFGVYLISITVLLILHKQKKFILPVLFGSLILLQAFPGLSSRFASTFQQVDLVVDSRSGKAIGVASEFGNGQIIIEDEQSTGENLPGGSKYINVPTQTGTGTDTQIVYKRLAPGSNEPQIISRAGKVIVKKAFAYDVSFTTRFQGEWPRAMDALERNYLLGSGYSSINLATDNNYLRILGEIGILGFASFISIFLIGLIFLWRIYPSISDARTKALVLGVCAGLLGVGLNAVLIDVFEASKLAFVMWLVMGVTLGLAKLYQKEPINYISELKRIFTSPIAYVLYLLSAGSLIFSRSLGNYFVADDFTWLRWAADCATRVTQTCDGLLPTISSFFLNSQNFYYRPGMKTLFYLAYPVFELFPTPYHVLSLAGHLASTVVIFFLSRKYLSSNIFAFITAFLFLILSIHFEALFWISTLGHIIASFFILSGLLSYTYFRDKDNVFLLALSWICLLFATFFHEFAVIGPLLILAIDLINDHKTLRTKLKSKVWYIAFLALIPLYYALRNVADSLWFAGDYRYSWIDLPLNVIGNAVSYIFLILAGPTAYQPLQAIRTLASQNISATAVILLVILAVGALIFFRVKDTVIPSLFDMKLKAKALFLIPLLPFLGLGNISPRYTYLASFGLILFVVYMLKKYYSEADKKSRKMLAIFYAVFVILFSYYQVASLLDVNKDWQKAGEIVNNTLVNITLSTTQENQPPLVNPVFYFINLPIRYGTAWVFPVGLSDALWFSYREGKLDVRVTMDEARVQQEANANRNIKVFKFLEDGSLVEYTPPITPTPIESELTPTLLP